MAELKKLERFSVSKVGTKCTGIFGAENTVKWFRRLSFFRHKFKTFGWNKIAMTTFLWVISTKL
jgi:hypothetical protein